MLALLQKGGVIKLKDGVDVVKATVKDIVENPKNLKFKTDVEPGLSPKLYENNEGDALFINSNYAIDAKLNPTKDAIAIEGQTLRMQTSLQFVKVMRRKKKLKS